MGTLLVALAHPDDETFGVGGVMSRAVDEGHRVVIVCATRGEAGEIADPALATREDLGKVREGELRAAARSFGVKDVRFLTYRDSGMAGTPENADPRALVNADPTEVVSKLLDVIRELSPDVVVTFDEGGVYGHPDHMAIHRHVTAAFDEYARTEPAPRPRLYNIAVPKSVVRLMMAAAESSGQQWGFGTEEDLERAPDDADVTVVDVTPWVDRKRAAVAAHATQRGTVEQMPAEFLDRMYATESFLLARGNGSGGLAGL